MALQSAIVAFDVDRVVGEVRNAADVFLRPRFRSLAAGDVREKSPGEVVTVADEECEAHLGAALLAVVPGSVLVGEEAASQDGSLLELLAGDDPVWLLDPLDGTEAFAAGSSDYAVMAALVVRGETVLSVIHQPEYGRTLVAERGSGAHEFEAGGRVALVPGEPGGRLRGAVMRRFLPPEVAKAVEENESRFQSLEPVTKTAGIEYPAIAAGERDFMLYWRTLPWDHVPGGLLISEAGGKAADLDGGCSRPAQRREGLLVASTPELWERAREELGVNELASTERPRTRDGRPLARLGQPQSGRSGP